MQKYKILLIHCNSFGKMLKLTTVESNALNNNSNSFTVEWKTAYMLTVDMVTQATTTKMVLDSVNKRRIFNPSTHEEQKTKKMSIHFLLYQENCLSLASNTLPNTLLILTRARVQNRSHCQIYH